jgi:hypothetical protein
MVTSARRLRGPFRTRFHALLHEERGTSSVALIFSTRGHAQRKNPRCTSSSGASSPTGSCTSMNSPFAARTPWPRFLL